MNKNDYRFYRRTKKPPMARHGVYFQSYPKKSIPSREYSLWGLLVSESCVVAILTKFSSVHDTSCKKDHSIDVRYVRLSIDRCTLRTLHRSMYATYV